MTDRDRLTQTAKIELARRHLWHYCQLRTPGFYLDRREYLRVTANTIEAFANSDDAHWLVINMPPRHGKTLTAQHLAEWLIGNDPTTKMMTASYNEILSQQFSKAVRNTIQEQKVPGSDRLTFSDVFPGVTIKRGDASAKLWGTAQSPTTNYLATSPASTMTGLGTNWLVLDDTIKSASEAYNRRVLDGIWAWFTNTAMQRLEGANWKVVVIMTRWSKYDIAGQIQRHYDGVETLMMPAKDENGKMLDDEILSAKDYELRTQEMNLDIAEANYNQRPIEMSGVLFGKLMTYEEVPEGAGPCVAVCDTADTGADSLVAIFYRQNGQDIYVTDVVCTTEPMEITEPAVADAMARNHCSTIRVESNNGGRGFARNIERLLEERRITGSVMTAPQTANKEARILASETFVKRHVFMPEHWEKRYPEFAIQVLEYSRTGKNQHDDALDCLATIYELTAQREAQVQSRGEMDGGLPERGPWDSRIGRLW